MNSDPRKLGGGIAGPGGPFDKDGVVVDTTNAVLLDATEVCFVGTVRNGALDEMPAIALVLRGRVNKTPDRVQVLFLTNADGAAALVSELVALSQRGGWGEEFLDRLDARLDAMPKP